MLFKNLPITNYSKLRTRFKRSVELKDLNKYLELGALRVSGQEVREACKLRMAIFFLSQQVKGEGGGMGSLRGCQEVREESG